jgi:hypothetical protein
MDFNFFTWLREGVRRSVLLGVSDAVEDLGAPEEGEIHPRLAQAGLTGALGQQKGVASTAPRRNASSGGRKRLGKSLTDIDGGK